MLKNKINIKNKKKIISNQIMLNYYQHYTKKGHKIKIYNIYIKILKNLKIFLNKLKTNYNKIYNFLIYIFLLKKNIKLKNYKNNLKKNIFFNKMITIFQKKKNIKLYLYFLIFFFKNLKKLLKKNIKNV